MAIRKRRNGQWFYRKWVRLPHGGRIRVFGTPREYGLSNTKAGTEEALRRKQAELIDGEKPTRASSVSSAPYLRDFESIYLEHSRINNKHSTYTSKVEIFERHLTPELGDRRLDEIDYAAIEDLKLALVKARRVVIDGRPEDIDPLGPKTINNVMSVLRNTLTVAVKRRVLGSVPEIDWLDYEDADFDFLTFDEADALLSAASKDGEWGVMVTVALKCGLRQSELLGLQWDDLDLRKGLLRVKRQVYKGRIGSPKSGKGRDVELGDTVLRALKAHRHLRSEWVFCNLDGKRYTDGECKWPLWRACKGAELRRIGWHVLRHTFASHLVMRGAPLRHVQELMGHSTIKMTERYAHLMPEAKRDVVKLLDIG